LLPVPTENFIRPHLSYFCATCLASSVDGLKVFYREAGHVDASALLLLHGFPSASHMFRDLIPLVADRFHIVAPDLPGFGQSEMPARSKFSYTFDNIAGVGGSIKIRQIACAASPRSSTEMSGASQRRNFGPSTFTVKEPIIKPKPVTFERFLRFF
jgi:pimeloyl-ACP methyl ester carboxylesterase